MWYSWCGSEALDATRAPFSWPVHFRNSYLEPTVLAPNHILRDDGRRQRRPRGPGCGIRREAIAAEEQRIEFYADNQAGCSSSHSAAVCVSVRVRSNLHEDGLTPDDEDPQSLASRRQEVAQAARTAGD